MLTVEQEKELIEAALEENEENEHNGKDNTQSFVNKSNF